MALAVPELSSLKLLVDAVVEGTEITPYIVLQVQPTFPFHSLQFPLCFCSAALDDPPPSIVPHTMPPQDSDCKRYISSDDDSIRCRFRSPQSLPFSRHFFPPFSLPQFLTRALQVAALRLQLLQ